ncbi:VOC family protein [Jiulongibacter sediminis]|uniref:VOC family protein n=1 Tax=Jiulongibacter sediminis TaxID=1605367 RepID=UPI001C116A69|nr:VOC family protein [Jiulongibacter sediminis]
MEFKYAILYVEKVKETLAFYQKAFGFDIKFIPPEEDLWRADYRQYDYSFCIF